MSTKRTASRLFLLLAVPALLLAAPGPARATIQPGETRVVSGTLAAVDAAARTVRVEVPVEKGSMTVGAYVPAEVVPTFRGKPSTLEALPAGHLARITYTREGDRLIVKALEVFAGK